MEAYLLVVPYLISCYGGFKYMQHLFYHPKGDLYKIQVSVIILIVVIFTPLTNTFYSIGFVIGSWKDDKYKKDRWLDRYIDKILTLKDKPNRTDGI